MGVFAFAGSVGWLVWRNSTERSVTPNTQLGIDTEELDAREYAWTMRGSALGQTAGNESDANVLMADVLRLPDGTYRMFYNAGKKGTGSIKYADSPDGAVWTAAGTALYGGTHPDDDDYIIGGSRVLRLQDGTYRMYYRATPEYGNDMPSYSIYFATSVDGKTFVKHGIAIPNTREDASSTLALAGHGAFYQMPDGTFGAFFSGNDASASRAPSDLFFTTSDDGITWEEPERAFTGFHDPTVVQTEDGYIVVAMYLKSYVGLGYSEDGVNWSKELEPIAITDANGDSIDLMLIGDLSTAVGPDGSVMLFSNYVDNGKNVIAQYE